MNFNDASNFDQITKAIEKLQKGNVKEADDRYWQPSTDKAGNGFAEIRFLPTPPMDIKTGAPWVEIFSYSFKGPTGKWYIENALSTLGQKDPVGEANSILWNNGDQDAARARSRRTSYISNIYVVNDPVHPENNGTVRLFRYGKKIFDKIKEVLQPTFADEKPLNAFDLKNGANFKIKIVQKEGFRNYDKSSFAERSPLMDNDDKLNEIWQKEFSLLAFIAPDQFKSYDELKKKFEEVTGEGGNFLDREPNRPASYANKAKAVEEDIDDEIPNFDTPAASDDDKTLDYFKNLAED